MFIYSLEPCMLSYGNVESLYQHKQYHDKHKVGLSPLSHRQSSAEYSMVKLMFEDLSWFLYVRSNYCL